MAVSGDGDVNLSALQRVDPYIVEVLDSATQVALYKFSSKENEWDKTGVEGTLFVYRRSAPPFYGFLIMNRLSKTNQVEPITKDLELKREDPYLLYRNFKCMNIFGIWFYEANDCVNISDAINRLLNQEREKLHSQPRVRRASESDSGLNKSAENSDDLFSMLFKAQEMYLKSSEPKPIVDVGDSASDHHQHQLVRPRALRVNSSGGGSDVRRSSLTSPTDPNQEKQLTIEDFFAKATSKGLTTLPTPLIVSSTCAESALPAPDHPQHNNPILQRLMSNPENLVEHIEKRQRNEILPLAQLLEEKLASFSTASSTETKSSFESCTSPKAHNNDSNFFTPAMFETPEAFVTPTKPPSCVRLSLMSPQMFSTPSSFSFDSTPSAFSCERRSQPPPPTHIQPTLTKSQLVQAFIYLLKTDGTFVSALHEAYVKIVDGRTANNSNGWKLNGLFN